MTSDKRACEFEALVCETNAIGAECEAMKQCNAGRIQEGMSIAYEERHFWSIAGDYKAMAEKFRKLAE